MFQLGSTVNTQFSRPVSQQASLDKKQTEKVKSFETFEIKKELKKCKICIGFVSCDDLFASAFLNQGNKCPVQNVSVCIGKKLGK